MLAVKSNLYRGASNALFPWNSIERGNKKSGVQYLTFKSLRSKHDVRTSSSNNTLLLPGLFNTFWKQFRFTGLNRKQRDGVKSCYSLSAFQRKAAGKLVKHFSIPYGCGEPNVAEANKQVF